MLIESEEVKVALWKIPLLVTCLDYVIMLDPVFSVTFGVSVGLKIWAPSKA